MTSTSSFLMSLADAAARSLLLAGAVGAGLWILRVRNVVAQKTAWTLVLVASLAMPFVARWAANASWLPDRDTFVITGRAPSSSAARAEAPPITLDTSTFVNRETDSAALLAPTAEPQPSRFPAPAVSYAASESAPPAPAPHRTPSPLAWLSTSRSLLMLYCAVCAAMLFRLLYGLWAAGRLWRLAEPVSLEAVNLPSGAALRTSHAVASPVTVASGVVLPADYASWDPEKLRIVLAHEISHLRQRDFALQLAASLYSALFWFSPLSWWLKRKLSRLAETISDGAAVHEAPSHASYAQVLLEFAALPRPISIGVAMAHRGHLRSRIEHLLNEGSFRQAFSGGRMRLAAAVLLVPVALFAATAMVRVHAAGQQTPPAQAPDSAAPTATPAPVVAAPQTPDQTAKPPAAGTAEAPAGAPSTPSAPLPPGDNLVIPGPGPNPPSILGVGPSAGIGPFATIGPDVLAAQIARSWAGNARSMALAKADMARAMALNADAFRYGFGNDGNSYAYVTGEGEQGIHYSGNWYDGSREEIEKARKAAHGDFVWFERDGKSYVIDDQAMLAGLKPMQEQMETLGKQQEELGKQQEELGEQQEALGRKQEEARVPTPDVSKEMADLNAAISKLNAKKGGTVSQEDLADLQGKIAELEGKLGSLEGEMGEKQGEIGRQQGELGAQQGKLGAQQGRLGAQQGRIAREMDGKVLTIIDECMKNGKARQVE